MSVIGKNHAKAR